MISPAPARRTNPLSLFFGSGTPVDRMRGKVATGDLFVDSRGFARFPVERRPASCYVKHSRCRCPGGFGMFRRNLALAAFMSLAAAGVPAIAQTCQPQVAPPHVATAGKLVLSINPTLPPMQFVDERGQLKGLNVDLAEEIAKRLCLAHEHVRIDFQAMIPGLQAGRWDVINTGIFWTEERSKIMYLVNYGSQAVSVLTPRGNPQNIRSVADLAGRSVAVETGTYAERKLRDFNAEFEKSGARPMTIRTFNTGAEGYQALAAGQVDVSASIDITAAEIVQRTGLTWAIKGVGGAPIAFAFRDRMLAQAFAGALTAMAADGSYDRLMDKYGFAKLTEAFAINGPGPR
jgi:polar amino acid transport system substrate-binding protein